MTWTIFVRQAFQAEIFALQGDDQLVGGGEGGGHEHAERWRAIDEQVVEPVTCGGFPKVMNNTAQANEVVVGTGEFDFDAGQIHVRGDNVEVFVAGGFDQVIDGRRFEKTLIDAVVFAGGQVERTGGIGLRVEVEDQHALAEFGETGTEVDRGGGFSDSALLVGDGDNSHFGTRSKGKGWQTGRNDQP